MSVAARLSTSRGVSIAPANADRSIDRRRRRRGGRRWASPQLRVSIRCARQHQRQQQQQQRQATAALLGDRSIPCRDRRRWRIRHARKEERWHCARRADGRRDGHVRRPLGRGAECVALSPCQRSGRADGMLRLAHRPSPFHQLIAAGRQAARATPRSRTSARICFSGRRQITRKGLVSLLLNQLLSLAFFCLLRHQWPPWRASRDVTDRTLCHASAVECGRRWRHVTAAVGAPLGRAGAGAPPPLGRHFRDQGGSGRLALECSVENEAHRCTARPLSNYTLLKRNETRQLFGGATTTTTTTTNS